MGKIKNFICPHCQKSLKPNTKVVLIIEIEDGERGLGLFSPIPGNYSIITNSNFPLLENEKMTIYCPICNNSLASKDHNGLCYLCIDGGEIYFAPNEKATFVKKNDKVISYGDAAKNYSSYFDDIDEVHIRIMG